MFRRAIALWTATLAVLTAAACATTRGVTEPPKPSYVIPALGIITFEAGLNAVDRRLFDDPSFNVTAGSVRRNLRSAWVIDDDSYEVNQFLHPYQGSVYHGFARSAGLNYWQSTA